MKHSLREKTKEKAHEAVWSVLPIMLIVLLLAFTIAPIPTGIPVTTHSITPMLPLRELPRPRPWCSSSWWRLWASCSWHLPAVRRYSSNEREKNAYPVGGTPA